MKTESTVIQELEKQFPSEQAMMLSIVIDGKITELRKEMTTKSDLEILKHQTAENIANAKLEMTKAQNRTILWMVGTMLTCCGLAIAALKLF